MMKKYKWKLIVSSVLILLPVFAGLFLWNSLPDVLTTHWGADGAADGQSGKLVAVLMPYIILLPVHWLCIFFTLRDHVKRPQPKKALGIVFWVLPFVSLFCGVMVYAAAFGKIWNSITLLPVILGILFLILGNYIPKIRQNHFMGVRLPWTFSSDENWNKTHRFCGRLWVIGGLIILLTAFLPEMAVIPVTIAVILVISVIPVVYSYVLYRHQLKRGEVSKISTRHGTLSVAAVIVILAAAVLLMVTGNINVTFAEKAFVVESTYWQSLTVEYDAIDSVEYLKGVPVGVRTNGFGSAKLQLGLFACDEYGNYIRYTYSGCSSGILIRSNDQTLIVNASNDEQTNLIYKELKSRIG